MYLTVEDARGLLPKVGDVRWEIPTIDGSNEVHTKHREAQRCIVVMVNRDHLWYTVEFENGIRECYKGPMLNPSSQGGGNK